MIPQLLPFNRVDLARKTALPPDIALAPTVILLATTHDEKTTAMKVEVGKDGVTIPKHMLGDAEKVDIREENGRVVVELLPTGSGKKQDPIFDLGKSPVVCNEPDASENHDKHLYG